MRGGWNSVSMHGFYLPGPGAILGDPIPGLILLEKLLTGLLGTCDWVYLPVSLSVFGMLYNPGPGTFITSLPVEPLRTGFILQQPLLLYSDTKNWPLPLKPNAPSKLYFCGPGTIMPDPIWVLNLPSDHLD